MKTPRADLERKAMTKAGICAGISHFAWINMMPFLHLSIVVFLPLSCLDGYLQLTRRSNQSICNPGLN